MNLKIRKKSSGRKKLKRKESNGQTISPNPVFCLWMWELLLTPSKRKISATGSTFSLTGNRNKGFAHEGFLMSSVKLRPWKLAGSIHSVLFTGCCHSFLKPRFTLQRHPELHHSSNLGHHFPFSLFGNDALKRRKMNIVNGPRLYHSFSFLSYDQPKIVTVTLSFSSGNLTVGPTAIPVIIFLRAVWFPTQKISSRLRTRLKISSLFFFKGRVLWTDIHWANNYFFNLFH